MDKKTTPTADTGLHMVRAGNPITEKRAKMLFSHDICNRNYPWNKQPDYDLEKSFESIETLLEKDSDVNQMQKEQAKVAKAEQECN